jgi:hypothetical protein
VNIDPGIVEMVGKFVAVNVVATLVLAVGSYALAAASFNLLEALDRWLSPSRRSVSNIVSRPGSFGDTDRNDRLP